MKRPDAVPPAVVQGVQGYARQHQEVDASELIATLAWDPVFGCYYFERASLWHGVELDGTVHT